MASGSPTVHSRLKAAHSPMTHSKHFVEDSPRTRIELARNNLIMQKELKKIEKQAKTAAMNVSNNQQALRMSLRQLESKRSSDSPLLTRSVVMDKKDSNASKRKLGLFANSTSLTVESTADAYRNTAEIGRARSRSVNEHHSLHNSERASAENGGVAAIVIKPADSSDEEEPLVYRSAISTAPTVQLNATDHQSPYISTPLNVRRVKLSRPFHSLSASQHLPVHTQTATDHRPATHAQEATLSQSCHTIRSLYTKPGIASGQSDEINERRGSLKLPPINATRTIISAHHNTTDKATLKKASQMLGLSSAVSNTRSTGPSSFQQFYKDAGSSLIIVSPPATPCGDRDDVDQSFDSDDEEVANGDVQNADSNVSLSEMFEQIKKCRYIRHYYPNGEKPPDAW